MPNEGGNDDSFETDRELSRPSARDETSASPFGLEPEEGVRLMRAFARIRRPNIREAVVTLIIGLADAEDRDSR